MESDKLAEELHEHTHFSGRSGWLRAAVLGANDGLISTSSIIVGVAAAATSPSQILLAGIAGLVGGATSMAAGEYVSVSSQLDTEKADLVKERDELQRNPDSELEELRAILMSRGMSPETARKAATEMTDYDAIRTHAREEIGLSDALAAKPLQAALASATAFIAGGFPPLLMALAAPSGSMTMLIAITAIFMLFVLGAFGAKLGGAPMSKAALRVVFWGALAMGATHLIGSLFGAQL